MVVLEKEIDQAHLIIAGWTYSLIKLAAVNKKKQNPLSASFFPF